MFDVKIVLSIKEQMLTAIATLRAHASEPYLLEKAIHNLNSASSEENSIIQSGIYLQQKGPPHTPPLIFFLLSSFTCSATSFCSIIHFAALSTSCLCIWCLKQQTNAKHFTT